MKVPSIHCFEKIYQVSSISSHLSAGSWSLQLPYAAPRGPGKALASPQVCISAAFFPHKKWWQNRVRMGLISVATSTWPNFSSETRRWGFTTGNAEPKSNALRASSSSLLGIFCYQDVLRVTWVKHPDMTMGTSRNKWPDYQLIWLIRKLYDRKNTARFCVQIMLTDLGCSILGFCSKLLSQHLSLLGAGHCWSGHDGQILTGVNMCTQSNVKG